MVAAVRQLGKIRGEVKSFMQRQQWLLLNAQWTQRTVADILRQLGITGEPPPEYQERRK